jgi:molecular chaperone DnaJ
MEKNYYDLLGVDKNASIEVVKKAYKKFAKTYHPDKQVGKTDEEKKIAEEEFKKINEAYSVLTEPEKRKLYDQFGADLGKSQGYGQRGGFDDIDLSEMMENMRRAHGFGSSNPIEKANISVNINIYIEEAYKKEPQTKTFKYNRKAICDACGGIGGARVEVCQTCQGTGFQTFRQGFTIVQQTCPSCFGNKRKVINPCSSCNSTGSKIVNEKIDVEIPIGAAFKPIVLNGKGHEILLNGNKHVGDLIIQVHLLPHNIFKVDNNGNLHIELKANIFDCIVGEQIKFKCVDGVERQFSLKQGTRDGEQFRLSLGLPLPNGERTNLYAHISHVFPDKLSNEQIKTIKKLK